MPVDSLSPVSSAHGFDAFSLYGPRRDGRVCISSKLFHPSSGSQQTPSGGRNSGSVVTSLCGTLAAFVSTGGATIGTASASYDRNMFNSRNRSNCRNRCRSSYGNGTGSANCANVRAIIVRSDSSRLAGNGDCSSSEACSLVLFRFFMPSENSKPRKGLSRDGVSTCGPSHPRCGVGSAAVSTTGMEQLLQGRSARPLQPASEQSSSTEPGAVAAANSGAAAATETGATLRNRYWSSLPNRSRNRFFITFGAASRKQNRSGLSQTQSELLLLK